MIIGLASYEIVAIVTPIAFVSITTTAIWLIGR